jgi:hypothetical protein
MGVIFENSLKIPDNIKFGLFVWLLIYKNGTDYAIQKILN